MCVAAIAAAALQAQSLADASDVARMRQAFDSAAASQPLRCEIHSLRPALDYSFRFQTGYRIDVPLAQYRGEGHELRILVRVIPEGREAVYLSSTARLPEVPQTNLDGEFAGKFVVGEGSYGVEVLVQDDSQRVCQAQWRIQAKRSGSTRDLKMPTPPGAVEEAVQAGAAAGEAERSGARIGRLTILVQAAPMAPGRAELDDSDVTRLSDALGSLVEQMPAQSMRVALFNLEQRLVLWKKDGFAAADLEDVVAEMRKLQLGTVDYKAMQGREYPAELMAHMLDEELHAAAAPDAVIVLGPAARVRDAIPSQWTTPPAFSARLFYLQYQSDRNRFMPPGVNPPEIGYGGRGRPTVDSGQTMSPTPMSDTIDRFMQRWKGETIVVRTPQEFADAIRKMGSRIPKRSAVGPDAASLPVVSPRLASKPAKSKPPLPDGRGSIGERRGVVGDEDPTEVLARLRDHVLAQGRRIPNYTCVQTVVRDQYEPATGRSSRGCDGLLARRKQPGFSKTLRLNSTDRLRLDVALAEGGEIYSWKGASQFDERDLDEWTPEGAIGTGPFAASLLSVFEPHRAAFTFEGERSIA